MQTSRGKSPKKFAKIFRINLFMMIPIQYTVFKTGEWNNNP